MEEEEEELIDDHDVVETIDLQPSEYQGIHEEMDEDDWNEDEVEMSDHEEELRLPIEGTLEDNTLSTGFELKDDSVQGFSLHQAPIYCVAMHPTLSMIATGGGDDQVYLWNPTNSERCFVDIWEGHMKESVSAIAFSTNGQYLAAAALDGTIGIWDVFSGRKVHSLEGQADIIWLKWHPRGNVLLSGSQDGTAWMWHAENGVSMQVFAGHNGPVTSGNFTPDGKWVVTGGEDGTLRLWDPKSGSMKTSYDGARDVRFHQGAIHDLVINSDSQVVWTASEDTTIKVFSLQTNKYFGSLSGHSESVESVHLAENLNILLSAGLDGKLQIWDLASNRLRSSCEHPEGLTKVVMIPESSLAVTASMDGIVRIWDIRTGNCEKSYHGHQDAVLDLTCNKNWIVTGSDDGWSLVFDVQMMP